jgi:hypothetical protein
MAHLTDDSWKVDEYKVGEYKVGERTVSVRRNMENDRLDEGDIPEDRMIIPMRELSEEEEDIHVLKDDKKIRIEKSSNETLILDEDMARKINEKN